MYNERLEELRAQMTRKNRLYFVLKDLKTQQKNLADEVYELELCKNKKQGEVYKLEKWSLSGVFYSIIGKKGQMLEWARKEAYEARAKYETAQLELQNVEAQIKEGNFEMRRLQRAEEQYQKTLEEKAEAIKSIGEEKGEELIKIEAEVTKLEYYVNELKEAISAGESARHSADKVLSSLDSAKNWGTWDLVGGGLVSDLAKHGHLDDAQSEVEILKMQLSRFKAELMDVTIHADMKVNIDGFLRFADYFFDGVFANWTVLDKINQSRDQVAETQNQILYVLNRLKEMVTEEEQKLKILKNQRETLIFNVEM